ncbi:MAG: hypothetical protein U9P11_01495 [Pseudomonadota bacterium]|nr:hypothetical protein [Pseudomonadota bacterium]
MSDRRRLSFLMWLAAMITASPGQSIAQQALVRAYDNPAQSIGQAYLTHYGDHCIALLPGHVAAETKIPAFLGEGNSQLGESDEINDLGDDLAVAQVSGNIAQDCGNSISTISRAVDALLRSQGLATLRSVNSDGTLANMSVTVVDNDGEMYLRVRPTNDKIQIRKGHSGSLLMVGDRPVGMLLSVSSKYGVGKVLRFDKLLVRAENHMAKRLRAGSSDADKPAMGLAGLDLAAAANGGSVSGWNTLPVDADHRPANLIANETAPPWRANVDHWPAEIELNLAGDKVIISRIELDGRDIPSAEELPGRVEIFVNVSSGERRWRSLLSREAEFDASGIAVFPIAPTWARQVKISIGNSRGANHVTSLRRIHVSNP